MASSGEFSLDRSEWEKVPPDASTGGKRGREPGVPIARRAGRWRGPAGGRLVEKLPHHALATALGIEDALVAHLGQSPVTLARSVTRFVRGTGASLNRCDASFSFAA